MNVTKTLRSALEFFGLAPSPVTAASAILHFEGEEKRQKRIEILLSNPFLKMNATAAAELEACGKLLPFESGAVLIHEGAPDDDVYWILYGEVKVAVQKKLVAIRKVPNSVGEKAATNPGTKRSATVTAHGPVVALKVSASEFISILAAHPDLKTGVSDDINARHNQLIELFATSTSTIRDDNPKGYVIVSVLGAAGFAAIAFSALNAVKMPLLVSLGAAAFLFAFAYPSLSFRQPRYRWPRMALLWLFVGAAGIFSRFVNFEANVGAMGQRATISISDPSSTVVTCWAIVMVALIVAALYKER